MVFDPQLPEWFATADPIPGYRLLDKLGAGGFGEVWKAEGPGGCLVALKFFRLGAKAAEIEVQALELLRSVHHAHLLTPFAIWNLDERVVVGMDLADGTLDDRLNQCLAQHLPGIPRTELLEYLRDAAKALDFLHEPRHRLGDKAPAAIQHRDVKPQNLLLCGGCVKVADFGLAKRLEQHSASHTGGLSLLYAAPEFFRGRVSGQSDQYSLAVTYCHLRGGRTPFAGSLAEITLGHLQNEPDLTMLPTEERAVVARALAKEPGKRWPTCRALVDALAQAGGPEVVHLSASAGGLPTTVPLPPTPPPVVNAPPPWGWMAVAGVLLLTLVVLVTWQFAQGPPNPTTSAVVAPNPLPVDPPQPKPPVNPQPKPLPPAVPERPFVSRLEDFTLLRTHLSQADPEAGRRLRFFSWTHLQNQPQVTAVQLRQLREALVETLQRVKRGPQAVQTVVLGPQQSLLAVDLRSLGWRPEQWRALLTPYPYALKHDRDNEGPLRDVASKVYELADEVVPVVRADWFVAAVGQGPLAERLAGAPVAAAISPEALEVARRYEAPVGLTEAAAELGFPRSADLRREIEQAEPLQRLGLRRLLDGTISRREWVSGPPEKSALYQNAANELGRGTPFLVDQ